MVLNAVDKGLGVLHPYSHGKGFWRQGDAAAMQAVVDVAGRVSGGQNHGLGIDCSAPTGSDPPDFSGADDKIGHRGLEADLAAGSQDGRADIPDDAGQFVGADVGLGLEADFRRRTVVVEDRQDPLDIPPFARAGVEFAV